MAKKKPKVIVSNTNKFSWYSFANITEENIKNLVLSDYQVLSKYNARVSNSMDFPMSWDVEGVDEAVVVKCKEMIESIGLEYISNMLMNKSKYGSAPISVIWDEDEIVDLVLLKPSGFRNNSNSTFGMVYNKNVVSDTLGVLYPLDYYSIDNPFNLYYCISNNGQSELECLYNLCMFRRRVIERWDIAFDKASVPSVIALLADNIQTPDGMTDQEFVDAVSGKLESLRSGTGIAIQGVQNILTVMGNTPQGYDTALSYIDSAIGLVILGSSRTTDSGNAGSYASDKTSEAAIYRLAKVDNAALEKFINVLLYWQTVTMFSTDKAPKVSFDRTDGYAFEKIIEAIKIGVPISAKAMYKYVPKPEDITDILRLEVV